MTYQLQSLALVLKQALLCVERLFERGSLHPVCEAPPGIPPRGRQRVEGVRGQQHDRQHRERASRFWSVLVLRCPVDCFGMVSSEGVTKANASRMTSLADMLWVIRWPPTKGAPDSLACHYLRKTRPPAHLSLFVCRCAPQSSDTEGAPLGLPRCKNPRRAHAPARAWLLLLSRLVPWLFYRQPQSSGRDKGALTAVSRCSQRAQPHPPDTCGLCTPSGSHGWHGLELQCTRIESFG